MAPPKKAICFVTNELYPLGPGGIGRMLYNFAKLNQEMGLPAEFHFLVPQALLDSRPDAGDLLQAAFANIATVHVCPSLPTTPTQMAQLLARAQEHPWTTEWLYGNSYAYYLGLLAAEERRGAPFDIIEFPDFGGWAVATIEAKRARLAFADTLISARIHSTQGMLYGVERYANDPGHWAGIMFDAERHLFAHADLIVGHDPQITAHTARFYGLEQRWESRSRLEFPPVFLKTGPDSYERADKVVPPQDNRACSDFLFGSRLQPVKRPDLFIRAAILFLERHPNHDGRFRLVCNGWDRAFVDGLKALVPTAMAQRILFLEKAEPDERLMYIDNSIVVVPSDYESLCLFAFEAALAGRKVILNGACPAFGNDFRWHDGDNCLLFDGSVMSLADTMERALTWQQTSFVDAVPDDPYWLGDLSLPTADVLPAADLQPGTAIVAYGAQSPSEFHRQFDVVCQIEQELEAAGKAYEIVFQLPHASFAPDGEEAALVRKRGWTLALSSGNRECPQMFGQRLVSLRRRTVFLLPFGYEVSPGFVPDAIRVMQADPSLAIVSGQIELVDGNTGRSDFVRIYSGEAPSTALLSSRIAPPLCLLNACAVSRIPFDPWAGAFWFEVFARTCALRGEGVVVMPVLAGTLDTLQQQQPETNKRIAAGLLDQIGIAAGWQARLLSVDPVQIPAQTEVRSLVYGEDQLRQIFRINPVGPVRSWEPVGWQDSAGAALVHPLEGHVTIGELAGPWRRISRLVAHVRNARTDNDGAEVAIALARSQVEASDVLKLIQDGGTPDDIAMSNWSVIEPGGSAQLNLACYGVSKGHDKVLLLSRPRNGGRDANAEIVFPAIDFHFNNLSIG
ncbi:glycosyltransferase family 4 protein [Novosphingobium sp. ERN07]|uniref:glycosyltransferase family 4 protein n=1 Tax=Novosphingobium sp. ERN07 TaxID=2726187 RepID=UPI00145666A7|nr:glycosyltransferase family 4 protein [Novosphingobium sp. ERN07]NLR72479.1 glycosyltransferase family 4 protein [Novosphingobium sp. ERN07]